MDYKKALRNVEEIMETCRGKEEYDDLQLLNIEITNLRMQLKRALETEVDVSDEQEIRTIRHPGYTTATSVRQEGFPMVAVTSDGTVYGLGRTTKAAVMLTLPGCTVAVLSGYRSNSGRYSVKSYSFKEKLEQVDHVEQDEDMERLPIQARDWAKTWLYRNGSALEPEEAKPGSQDNSRRQMP